MLVIRPVKAVRKETVYKTITGLRVAHPKAERLYIQILETCSESLRTVPEIFGKQEVLTQELTDLIRLGYLERYEDTAKRVGIRGRHPYFYHTTEKGKALVKRAYTAEA